MSKDYGLISKAMNDAINEQIGNELTSQIQYVAIAAHFDKVGLPELAKFFYTQAEDEKTHAMRFVKFLSDAGGTVVIPAIAKPQSSFTSAEAAVQRALDGELRVTRQINALVDKSVKESDHITHNFLQWFVTEQLEEFSTMDTLLKMVVRVGEKNLLDVEEYLSMGGVLAHGAQGGKANK